MSTLPEYLEVEGDHDTSVVLLAAWMRNRGERFSYTIARAVGAAAADTDRLLDAVGELLGDYESCLDDPAEYAWRRYGLHRPFTGGRSMEEWGVGAAEDLLRDVREAARALAHPFDGVAAVAS